MMNNSPEQPSATDNGWFYQNEPALPEPKKPITRKLALLLPVAVIVLVAIVMFVIPRASSCLTAQDYQAFTGRDPDTSVDDIANDFYAQSINFRANSTDYSDTEDSQAIQKIGEFFADRSSKAIIITISVDYYDEASLDMALERSSTIRSSLISAGVTESSIELEQPIWRELEDGDESEISETANLSISSAEGCK